MERENEENLGRNVDQPNLPLKQAEDHMLKFNKFNFLSGCQEINISSLLKFEPF